MELVHDSHSSVKQQSPGVGSEVKDGSHGKDTPYSTRRNWLKNSSLSKSMPHNVNQGFTAEDENVLSMRTYRYLKMIPDDTAKLPPPCKFVNLTRPNCSLPRSKSAQGFGASAGALCQASNTSIIARLRECLFMDDFQLHRPPSFVVTCESNMGNAMDADDAHANISGLHFVGLEDPHDAIPIIMLSGKDA
jgi:hypothetical protein